MVMIPAAISPHGRWRGPMFHNFLFGRIDRKQYSFSDDRPNAQRMFVNGTTTPCAGVLERATREWKARKSKRQFFFGNSHTVPTPDEFALQQFLDLQSQLRSPATFAM